MSFVSARGTCIAIAASQPTTYDAAGYAALEWENIGEVSDPGEWGGEFNEVTFEDICTGVLQKDKGTFDPGSADVTLAVDLDDTGQNIAIEYYDGDKERVSAPIRITDPRGQVFYCTARVMSYTYSASSPNDPYTASVSLGYDRRFVRVLPGSGT